MTEQELAEQLQRFQELGKQDKNVNVAALAMAAFQAQRADMLTDKEKRKAYWISLLLPPAGLYYAAKFYTSGKTDGKQAAWMCVTLTVLTIVGLFAVSGVMFKTSGLSVEQLKQAPAQLQDLNNGY